MRRPRPRLHGDAACVRDAQPKIRELAEPQGSRRLTSPWPLWRPSNASWPRGAWIDVLSGRPRVGLSAPVAYSLLLQLSLPLLLLDTRSGSCLEADSRVTLRVASTRDEAPV